MSMHNNEEFLGKNSDELYIQFKGIINKIQKRYSFLELEENEFKSLVLLILDKCLKTYEKNDTKFINYISIIDCALGSLFRCSKTDVASGYNRCLCSFH